MPFSRLEVGHALLPLAARAGAHTRTPRSPTNACRSRPRSPRTNRAPTRCPKSTPGRRPSASPVPRVQQPRVMRGSGRLLVQGRGGACPPTSLSSQHPSPLLCMPCSQARFWSATYRASSSATTPSIFKVLDGRPSPPGGADLRAHKCRPCACLAPRAATATPRVAKPLTQPCLHLQ